MNTVSLVQCRDKGNAFEKERIKTDVVLLGKLRIDLVKFRRVSITKVAWRLHACKNDMNSGSPDPCENGIKIGKGLFRRQTAQGIIAAKFNDNQMWGLFQGPFQTCQPSGGRVARNTGIDDDDIVTGLPQSRFQLRWKSLLDRQTVTCGQTVAQNKKTFQGFCCIIGQ